MASPSPSRLGASVRGLAGTLLALLQVRLELLSVEAQEEVVRLAGVMAYGAIAVVCLSLGMGFVAVAITVALWETQRLLALAVFSTLFLLLGLLAAWQARERVRQGSRLFASSIEELKRDRSELGP
jgi:uncharacterized membrane protein YqjE